MEKAIIGKKIGMTQIFDENGKVIPVTVVEAGPCVITQKKQSKTMAMRLFRWASAMLKSTSSTSL